MKRWNRCLVVVLLFTTFHVGAQVPNVSFSQYFNFPALHNPAFAGDPSMDYRVAGIYRQQWRGIDAEFQTFGVAGDMPIGKKLLGTGSLGLGFYAIDDHLGNDVVQKQELGISLSYHRPLDFQERHLFSMGISANYSNSSIDLSSLSFENQYEGFIFNGDLPTGEGIENEQIQNINFGLGINYRFIISPKYQFSAGASISEILQPNQFFLSDSLAEEMAQRWVGFGSLKNHITSRISLVHHLQMVSIGKATGVRIGTIGQYSALESRELRLDFGLFYQIQEAFTLYGGVNYKNCSLNLSYDFTASSLNEVTASNQQELTRPGTIEVSFVYKALRQPKGSKYSIPCRFF